MITNITLNGDKDLEDYLINLDKDVNETLKEYSCVSNHHMNKGLMFIWAPEMTAERIVRFIEHETIHLVLYKINESKASNQLNDIYDMEKMTIG